jgi:hypothetical protein
LGIGDGLEGCDGEIVRDVVVWKRFSRAAG